MANIDHGRFPNPLPKQLWGVFFEMGLKDKNLKDDIVGSRNAKWSAKDLNPTQEDVYLSKSLSMAIGSKSWKGIEGGDLKSIVSHDGYILDGHHRWAATLWNNPSAQIGGIEVALNIVDLVPILRAAGDAFGNARRGEPKGDRNIFQSSIKDVLEAVKDGKGMTTPESTYDHDWCMQWLANLGKGKIADGEKLLAQRLAEIKKHKTPSTSPARKDMPVIDTDKNAKIKGTSQEKLVAYYLRKGAIDLRKPYG